MYEPLNITGLGVFLMGGLGFFCEIQSKSKNLARLSFSKNKERKKENKSFFLL